MNNQDLDRYRAAESELWDRYGVTPTERFIPLPSFNNLRVRVQEIGEGEPVLFVHGSPNAGSKWAPLVARLSGFRCILLDRPGCGLSDAVDYRGLDLRQFGADLLTQTLDGLGLPRVKLVASSIGGALAFYFTYAHPERVERLVQEGCPAFVRGFRVPFYNLLSSAQSLVFHRSPPSLSAFRQLGHAAGIDSGRFAAEVLVWRDALLKHTPTLHNEDRLNSNIARRSRAYAIGAELEQIATPTLYLWGEDDPFGGVEVGRRCAAAQPHAVLRTFPLSGHLPWLDDPDTHARLIRAFLHGEALPDKGE